MATNLIKRIKGRIAEFRAFWSHKYKLNKQLAMALPIDKLFLVIAIIAMPNLYYRAQYNVPLMLFCFGVWHSVRHRAATVYLNIFSWVIDIYYILRTLAANQEETTQPRIVIILQIAVFVLKVQIDLNQVITIVMLVIADREAREAINPQNMCVNINKALHEDSLEKSRQGGSG